MYRLRRLQSQAPGSDNEDELGDGVASSNRGQAASMRTADNVAEVISPSGQAVARDNQHPVDRSAELIETRSPVVPGPSSPAARSAGMEAKIAALQVMAAVSVGPAQTSSAVTLLRQATSGDETDVPVGLGKDRSTTSAFRPIEPPITGNQTSAAEATHAPSSDPADAGSQGSSSVMLRPTPRRPEDVATLPPGTPDSVRNKALHSPVYATSSPSAAPLPESQGAEAVVAPMEVEDLSSSQPAAAESSKRPSSRAGTSVEIASEEIEAQRSLSNMALFGKQPAPVALSEPVISNDVGQQSLAVNMHMDAPQSVSAAPIPSLAGGMSSTASSSSSVAVNSEAMSGSTAFSSITVASRSNSDFVKSEEQVLRDFIATAEFPTLLTMTAESFTPQDVSDLTSTSSKEVDQAATEFDAASADVIQGFTSFCMRRRPSQGTALAPELVVQLMGYRGTVDRHYFPFVIASFLDQYLSGAPLPVWLCLLCTILR